MQNQKIIFTASFPPLLSAITVDGVDGNVRIKLDIPASDMLQVVQLQAMVGKAFKVTVEELEPSVVVCND